MQNLLRISLAPGNNRNSKYCSKKLQNCRNNCRNKPVMALSFDILLFPTIPDIKLSSDERTSPQLIFISEIAWMCVGLGPGAWADTVRRLRCDLSWRRISKF